jgi:hypothetical protein
MARRRASPSTGSPRARGVPLDAAVISGPAVVVRCSTRATHHTGGSSWRHCIPPLNASRGHSRGRPVRGGTVHGSRPSPGERGWVGQASLTRTRRRSGGTSRSGPMMSGSIPTRDSPARAAATHARLTGRGFSVCSSCLRPHSMEAGYVSGLGRSALRSGCTAGVHPGMSERIGSGDRQAAGSKARRPAVYPGNREAQTPRSPSCGGCNSAALRSDWPGKSSSSNCGSMSWKPTKPKISKAAAEGQPLPIREGDRPKRTPLPDHLPRRAIVHEPVHDGACTCPACGGDNTICAVAEPPTDRRP